jgi:hypothetical protein
MLEKRDTQPGLSIIFIIIFHITWEELAPKKKKTEKTEMKASICVFAFALRQGSPMGILAKLSSPLSRYTSLLTGPSKVGWLKLCCKKKIQDTSNHRLKHHKLIFSHIYFLKSHLSKKLTKNMFGCFTRFFFLHYSCLHFIIYWRFYSICSRFFKISSHLFCETKDPYL